MTQTSTTPLYTLADDEKVGQIMVYTANSLLWGEVVVKSIIRIGTWLRTNSAPDVLRMYNVKMISTTSNTPPRPIQFNELYMAVPQVMAYHLVPPAKDPLDYDPSEPNRILDPVTLMVNSFRIEGLLRLSSRSSLGKFLEVTHENFTAIYDAKITNILISSLGTISVPFLLVRQANTIFTHA